MIGSPLSERRKRLHRLKLTVYIGFGVKVQRLLTDIAMLEVVVLRLETQATALEWDIAHTRSERETIEHTLNTPRSIVLQPRVVKLAPASPPSSPRLSSAHRVLSPSRSPAPKSPVQASLSPSHLTLKELLHTPTQEPEQFEFLTPPKSPRRSLRSLWSALDSQPQASFPTISKKVNLSLPEISFGSFNASIVAVKCLQFLTLEILAQVDATDLTQSPRRAALQRTLPGSPPDVTKFFPSAAGILPPNLHLSSSLSPYTPGEQPRTNTPVTPACQPDTAPRKSLNPARFLVSTKRLAFWNNFSSSTDDAASLNNRAANPIPEGEQLFVPEAHDCSSILNEVSRCASNPIHAATTPASLVLSKDSLTGFLIK